MKSKAACSYFLLRSGEMYSFRFGGTWPPGTYHVAPNLWLGDSGEWTVVGPYKWDGNSAKVTLGPIVIGVSDGPLLPDGTPAGKWPSLGHDIIYENIADIVRRFDVSWRDVRSAIDRWFRDEWVRQLSKVEDRRERERWTWRIRNVYYPAVRTFGWALALRRLVTGNKRYR